MRRELKKPIPGIHIYSSSPIAFGMGAKKTTMILYPLGCIILWLLIGEHFQVTNFPGPHLTKKDVIKSWAYIAFWPVVIFLKVKNWVLKTINHWNSLPDE
jgi:hypothetical protein